MLVKVQQDDFKLSDVTRYFKQTQSAKIGAIVTFTGLVREFQHSENDSEQVTALTLEHYPAMTESSLKQIASEAQTRWQLEDILIIHRVGTLYPSDNIVLVATASAHRQNAFDACQFAMDYLKTSAPFWKKEQTTKGARWVEEKTSDQDAIRKWHSQDQKVD